MTDQVIGHSFTFSPERKLASEGLLSDPLDPLALTIPDEELVDVIDQRIRASRTFYKEKYNLYDRRRELEKYYFGLMTPEDEKNLKDYESHYKDNVLYEI